jgi:hypothetical protein
MESTKEKNPKTEEVLLTIESPNGTGNSYYYEYYDEGLGSSVQLPRDSFVRAVTNFEYEDEIYDPSKQDYVYKTFYKYHNPEDGQVYTGYEVKKI